MSIIDRTINSYGKISYLKKTITTFVLLFAVTQVYSQTEVVEKNPFIYTKNSFAISLGNGFNRTQFTSEIGADKPRPGLGLIPRLNFDYRFSLGDHFGISLGTGFGFFPFRYKVDPKDDFSGTEGWAYWHLTNYEFFSDLKVGLDYNVWLNEHFGLKTTIGAGLMGTSQLGALTSAQSNAGYEYIFQYAYMGGGKPYIFLSTKVDRVLKNDNLLGLSLSYEYFFNSIYNGEYYLYNNQSNGTFVNRGNNISLSLAYTFTRARKLKYAEEIFVSNENIKFKDAKRSFKKERRYIDPKSTFFNLSGGLFFARNQVGFGEHLLKSGSYPSWIVSANMEKGIKSNHFWEAGLSISETWSFIRLNRPYAYWSVAGNEFVAVQGSFGFGTRLISKKSNINLLNVSAGLSLGVHTSQKGPSGYSSGTSGGNPEILYEYLVTYSTKRNIYPTLYLNLSRDFQLTESLYLSLDYRFNLGIIDVVQGDVELMEQPDFSNVLTDQIKINGTSNAFQIGVKYKLSPRSK